MSGMESEAKKPRLSCEMEQDRNRNRVAGPNELSPPDIFKLNIDCCDEIFEYLSLKDLHSFGQTCKAMQTIAGEYVKQNYSAAETFIGADGIKTIYSNNDGLINQQTSTSGFKKFITSITYCPSKYNSFDRISSHFQELVSINSVCLSNLDLDKPEYVKMNRFCQNAETLQIENCSIDRCLYGNYLMHCKNLKRLYIQLKNYCSLNKHSPVFHQKYSKLEHFEYISVQSIDDLGVFLQNNTNLKRFSTSSQIIWKFQPDFMKSTAKLDLLEVKECLPKPKAEKLCRVLKELYENGFFQRLHLFTIDMNEENSCHFASLPALEKVCIKELYDNYQLPQFTNLKELAILDGANLDHMEILASSLTNIQRLYIGIATTDDILPFFRLSPKLEKVKIVLEAEDDNQSNEDEGVFKLHKLNNERKKLYGARKVTIFVPDNIFLKTKWATRYGDINLNLVAMRRSDSFEWKQHYFNH